MTAVISSTETLTTSPTLLRRLMGNLSGMVGLVIVTIFVVMAIMGALGITPYPSIQQHPKDRLKAPCAAYLMGTDLFGRDITSRVMEGAGNSFKVAFISVALSSIVGIILGMISGFAGGRLDNFIMRFMDIFFAFPSLLLALVVVTVMGTGLIQTALAIAVVYTPIFARVARGPVLAAKEREFVLAARCVGMRPARILLFHIFPNTLAPIIVQISLALSWSLLTEAGLSFLGLGTQPPAASWGVMLSEGRNLAEKAPWLIIFPGLAIMLGVLGFNLLGDGLRDVLDPRMRGTR